VLLAEPAVAGIEARNNESPGWNSIGSIAVLDKSGHGQSRGRRRIGFIRRSGTIMRAAVHAEIPAELTGLKNNLAPNCVAESGKRFLVSPTTGCGWR